MVDFPDLLADAAIDNEINNDYDDGPPREVTVMSDHGGNKDDVDELIDDLLSESHDYTVTSKNFGSVEKSKKSFDSSPVTMDTTRLHRTVGHEVIHLEDVSERLSSRDFAQDGKGFNKTRSASSRRSDDDTSETSESDDSFQNDNRAGLSGQSCSSENEDDNSDGTQALLERAHDRIALQSLQDEIQSLKAVIEKKNMEVEHISGQLRRAISTKCDLVLAHTELEKHHEYNLHMKEVESHMLMKVNFDLLENRAGLEKDLMNEIVKLTREINDTKTQRQEELDDWERMHKNAILEKDLQIAQLKEELRRMKAEPSGQFGRKHGHSGSTGVLKGLIFQ
jgi:hypothetical protein